MPIVGGINVTDEQMKNPRIRQLYLEAVAAEKRASATKKSVALNTVSGTTDLKNWGVNKILPGIPKVVESIKTGSTKPYAQFLSEKTKQVFPQKGDTPKQQVEKLTSIAFNFMGTSGSISNEIEAIAQSKLPQEIAPILKRLGVLDEYIKSASETFAKVGTPDAVSKLLKSGIIPKFKLPSGNVEVPKQTEEQIARDNFNQTWQRAYGNRPATVEQPTQLQQRASAGKPLIDQPIGGAVNNPLMVGISKATTQAVRAPAQPQTDPLLTEARKYKSAEEFAAEKATYYHTTKPEIAAKIEKEGFKPTTSPGNVYLHDNKVSSDKFSKRFGGSQGTYALKGKVYDLVGDVQDSNVAKIRALKELDIFDESKHVFGKEFLGAGDATPQATTDLIRELKSRGYVGWRQGIDGEVVVWNPEDVLTRSQLTDIWKKAQGEGGIPGRRGLDAVGMAPEKPQIISKPEDVLLRGQIRAEARTAKKVATATRVETRDKLFNEFRNKSADIQLMRTEIINYAKANLPLAERGKLLTVVRNAITPKELADALIRIDRVAEETLIKKTIGEIKATVSKVTDSSRISADYKKMIQDTVDQYELTGHSQETLDSLKKTQDFINKARSLGDDVEIPDRIIQKLQILQRVPKDDLTLATVEKLKGEIDLLTKLGETKLRTREALYEAEKALRKQELLEEAIPIRSIQNKRDPLADISNTEAFVDKYTKLRNGLQKTNIGLMPMDGLAEITGMAPMKAALDVDFSNYLTANDEVFAKLDEIISRNNLTEVSFRRVGTYAIANQKGGLERLIQNNGISEEKITAIELDKGEKELYEFVVGETDKVYPALKQWALDEHNVDVGKVDNYVSFQADFDAMNDIELYDRFGTRADQAVNTTKNVEKGFTKERSEMSTQPLQVDIVKVFERHMDDVAYALNMGRDIKMYFEIVNSPEMKEKLGDIGAMAWKQYLDLLARKGGIDGSKRIAFLDAARKNLTVGVLGFRLSSALVQLTSFSDSIATIGAEWATRGATSIATSREWRNFVMDNFPEVKKAIGDDVAFRELRDGFLGKAGEVSMVPLKVLDGLMRSSAVAGAYQKLMAEAGKAIDFANPDAAIIAEATKLTRFSQGSSFFKDQPLAITTGMGLTGNRSVNKLILTFQSFMLNRWDNIKRQIWRVGIKEKNYTKAATATFWLLIFASAMAVGIRRGTKKAFALIGGEYDEEDPFWKGVAREAFQNVPIFGSIASSLEYGSNPVPVIKTIDDAIDGMRSVLRGKAPETKVRGAIRMGGALGSLFVGVPGASQSAQILRDLVPESSSGSSGNRFLDSSNSGGGSNRFLDPGKSTTKNRFLE